ncbi:MAG: hypothetical protein KGL11_02245 [Alphaproteobacteria bacterium]|nr:hypothetical protein [Alphaproteobacteria bacterium]
MASHRDTRRGLCLVAALVLPILLAACGGGPPPPMVLNSDAPPSPPYTGVDACGHRLQMPMVAHGTFGGPSAPGGGTAAEGTIVTDDKGNNWGVTGSGTLIGPAERMPDGNWKVTPQSGATPSMDFPCPPPSTRPMAPTPSGSQG